MDAHTQDKLTCLLRTTFESDDLVAAPELSFDLIAGADSLGKVRLFLEIEDVFEVHFSTLEMGSLENIDQLARLIESKRAGPHARA